MHPQIPVSLQIKTIIYTCNTKHRCDKIQMFSPALCATSVSEENQCSSQVFQKNVYSCHINHICVTLLPLQEFTSQSYLQVYFKKQICIATSHVVQQTCLSDYISHHIRLIFIQSADQPG